jgi:hypothetical protein
MSLQQILNLNYAAQNPVVIDNIGVIENFQLFRLTDKGLFDIACCLFNPDRKEFRGNPRPCRIQLTESRTHQRRWSVRANK